jgi:hypothetical protein
MIEFNVKIRIDTQCPERAYHELRSALDYNGLSYQVNETWLANNRPLSSDVSKLIADAWQRKGGFTFYRANTPTPLHACKESQVNRSTS